MCFNIKNTWIFFSLPLSLSFFPPGCPAAAVRSRDPTARTHAVRLFSRRHRSAGARRINGDTGVATKAADSPCRDGVENAPPPRKTCSRGQRRRTDRGHGRTVASRPSHPVRGAGHQQLANASFSPLPD